jgi:hypothetical protein
VAALKDGHVRVNVVPAAEELHNSMRSDLGLRAGQP